MKIQLSHSSGNLILGCQQKYVYYKVDKFDKDSDYEESNALTIGKLFHECLEQTTHELKGFTPSDLRKVFENYDLDFDEHGPLLYAMLATYKDLHEKSGLEVFSMESQISDKDTLGYVDIEMRDSLKGLWVVDVKTAANISYTLYQKLETDRQLNLYLAKKMTDEHVGTKYRVISKPKLKRKEKESFAAYFKRLYKSCKGREYTIHRENMIPEATYETHKDLHRIARSLHKGKKPIRNYNFCEAFFKPCEYWSRCHSRNFTDKSTVTSIEV